MCAARYRYQYNDPDSGLEGAHGSAVNQGLISTPIDSDMRATYTSTPAPYVTTSSPAAGEQSLTGAADPFRARGLGGSTQGLGGSTRNMSHFSSSSTNYLEATRDLSPLRAEYSLTPPHAAGAGGGADLSPPDHLASPPPYAPQQQHSSYVTNTFTGPAAYTPPSRDYSSSGGQPPSAHHRQQFYDSRRLNSASHDTSDLNKSNSVFYSGDRRDPHQPFYSGHQQPTSATDTPRVARVRDNYLRQRMSDDDVPVTPKHRSHSAGDQLDSGDHNGRASPRMRTPSAPANLNHSTQLYQQRDTPISERVLPPAVNQSVLSSAGRSALSRNTTDSRVGDAVLSRSIMSGEYRVRDTSRSMLSSVSLRLPHDDSRTSRDVSGGALNYSHSLPAARDGANHKQSKTPNGTAKPIGDHVNNGASKHSLDLSKSSSHQLTFLGRNYGVVSSLVSLVFIATLALVIAFLAAQLLFHITDGTVDDVSDTVLSNSSHDTAQGVTVALTTFVLMLDVCCLLVTSMQFFFAVKLVKCPQGDER